MSGTSALRLESPEVRADAAEADLHLVGDADGAGRARVPVGGREVPGRKHDLPAAGEQALAEEAPADRRRRAPASSTWAANFSARAGSSRR